MTTHIRPQAGRYGGLGLTTLLIAAALWLVPLTGKAAPAAGPVANAYVLRVDGLACPYCAYGIEKQFSGMKDVTGTDINIEKGVMIVHVKPGTRYTTQQIKSAVKDAGFTLKRVVSTPQQAQ